MSSLSFFFFFFYVKANSYLSYSYLAKWMIVPNHFSACYWTGVWIWVLDHIIWVGQPLISWVNMLYLIINRRPNATTVIRDWNSCKDCIFIRLYCSDLVILLVIWSPHYPWILVSSPRIMYVQDLVPFLSISPIPLHRHTLRWTPEILATPVCLQCTWIAREMRIRTSLTSQSRAPISRYWRVTLLRKQTSNLFQTSQEVARAKWLALDAGCGIEPCSAKGPGVQTGSKRGRCSEVKIANFDTFQAQCHLRADIPRPNILRQGSGIPKVSVIEKREKSLI